MVPISICDKRLFTWLRSTIKELHLKWGRCPNNQGLPFHLATATNSPSFACVSFSCVQTNQLILWAFDFYSQYPAPLTISLTNRISNMRPAVSLVLSYLFLSNKRSGAVFSQVKKTPLFGVFWRFLLGLGKGEGSRTPSDIDIPVKRPVRIWITPLLTPRYSP